MSDTVKLIIEISKKEYEDFKELIAINIGGRCSGKGIIQTCLIAVKNGIPLEDIKAEMEELAEQYKEYRYANTYISLCIKIIDKHIGKAESEDKE